MGDQQKFKIGVSRRKKRGNGFTYYVFDYDTQSDKIVCKQGEFAMKKQDDYCPVSELLAHSIRFVPLSATHNTLKTSFVVAEGEEKKALTIDYGHTVADLFVDGMLLHSNKADKMPIKAIFDTGAQSVCVRQHYADKMGWKQIGESVIGGAVGHQMVPIYRGNLSLTFDNGHLKLSQVVAWGAPLPGEIDVLIGQPVIKRFVFEVAKGFKGLKLS